MRGGGAGLQADHGGEEKQVGDEERDDAHADHDVVCAANGGSSLTENGDDDAGCAIDAYRNPRRAEAGMDGAECGREIAVDSHGEGQAGGGR